jgi:hypothetical protein
MRPAPLLVAAALAAAGCSDSPCQELGERLCACQPGTTRDACETRVEDLLDRDDPGEGFCEDGLATCNAPEGAVFCEWLLTEDGKTACGLAPRETAP